MYKLFRIEIFSYLEDFSPELSKALLGINRLILGVFQSVSYPTMLNILSKWCPNKERTKISNIVFAGAKLGAAFTFPVCGYLISLEVNYIGGWVGCFYLFGILGLIWCVLWKMLIHDSPDSHPTISDEESKII